MEILRETMAKTRTEIGRNANFYQQKIRSLEAQWNDIILENDCSDEMRKLISESQDEYDNGMATIYDKIQNTEEVKLPQINIPVFDGSYALWKNFYAQAIHNNSKLGDVQKLQCLTTHTKLGRSKSNHSPFKNHGWKLSHSMGNIKSTLQQRKTFSAHLLHRNM